MPMATSSAAGCCRRPTGRSTIAIQVAGGRVATVAVKEFRFLAPVLVGDLVELYARLERTGNTSMSVEVDVWAQGEPDPSSRRHVAHAMFVYVAVDTEGRPRRLPEPAPTPV